MVGKIGEGVEREGVRGINHEGVVVGDEGIVVFEHFEPVQLLLLGRVCLLVLFAPSVEEIGRERGKRFGNLETKSKN